VLAIDFYDEDGNPVEPSSESPVTFTIDVDLSINAHPTLVFVYNFIFDNFSSILQQTSSLLLEMHWYVLTRNVLQL
jgi:hypothetical protein